MTESSRKPSNERQENERETALGLIGIMVVPLVLGLLAMWAVIYFEDADHRRTMEVLSLVMGSVLLTINTVLAVIAIQKRLKKPHH